jgi:hypothetical protein
MGVSGPREGMGLSVNAAHAAFSSSGAVQTWRTEVAHWRITHTGVTLTHLLTSMSAIAANPIQESSSGSTPFSPKMHSKANPQQLSHLQLCIPTNCVGLYPQPPTNITSDELAYLAMTTGPPNPTSPSNFTCLLSGPLDDFLLYSGPEQSQWLIDIAHDICDPSLKRGSLQVWDVAGESWRNINPTDPLITSNYLYNVPDQVIVSLSKISERARKSKTSASGNASTMADHVTQRDGQQCWVTRSTYPTMNSHVCPKRMGDYFFHIIYSTFVPTPPPPALSVHHEICGITLSPTIDILFDKYELGLRLVALVRRSSFLVFYNH